MIALIAMLAAMDIRDRRPPGRAALLTVAALVAIALGCGPEETPDPATTKLPESKPAPDRPTPRPERAKTAPRNAPQIPAPEPSTATDPEERADGERIEPTSDAFADEQAELLSQLDSPDPEMRAEAVDWIDLDEDSLERLVALLESDPDVNVRATVVDRLGEDVSPEAIAALIIALRDPDPEIVLQAMDTLGFEAEEWLLREMDALLANPDPEVREAARDWKELLE